MNSTEQFLHHFSKISPLTPAESQAITESMLVKQCKKDTFLLQAGQYSIDTYYVLEGCIRQYLIVEGEEKTTQFFTEDQWVIATTSMLQNRPSDHYLVCVEDTTVSVGNEQLAQAMFKKFPRFETIARAVMETAFATQQQWMMTYLTDSPEQRYLKLLETRPDIFQRVPQYQLASYIGVKPESLSRIRKRLLEKRK